jgi:putative nucleotidyltransferase with HDIG domain
MKLNATFLRSKVARRIFLLFVLCALLPIGALAAISFGHVTQQLTEQSQRQLRQASKAQGMSIYERLRFLEADMKLIASTRPGGVRAGLSQASAPLPTGLEERFQGLEIVAANGRRQLVFGRMDTRLDLTTEERRSLTSGKSVVSTEPCDAPMPCIFMSQDRNPQHPGQETLIGQINSQHLWDIDKLPALTDLCILDQSNRVLFCSTGGSPSFPEEVMHQIARSTSGQFQWTQRNTEYLAAYWGLYLKPTFFTPRWIVVLSEAKEDALLPLAQFKRLFLLVILLAVWVVLLLSLVQIRRSLGPLEQLQAGTRRVAHQDFQTRVTVASGDEFQELANSFNSMAGRLGRQFTSLKTINEIDRAILSSWDTEKIVDTVLVRLRDLLPYDGVGISLLDPNAPSTATTYVSTADPSAHRVETTLLTPDELQALRGHPEILTLEGRDRLPSYLAPLAERGMTSFLIAPIFLNGDLSAVISLGHPVPPVRDEEDTEQVRQVADQVAVALANARLVGELHQLSWGTLTALARAIDAKSPWTTGHSERVTSLAVKIGRAMSLPPRELEILHRGGLLHDIGKIGTPGKVLDKPGTLSEQERQEMQAHVRIGARILEPIPGFAECIPIVLQHHEWLDGSGYPNGLRGEAISLHARILAVADCYDAMVSDRPYRAGLAPARVIDLIKENAGKQFDPRVVEAFLAVVALEECGGERQAVGVPSVAIS